MNARRLYLTLLLCLLPCLAAGCAAFSIAASAVPKKHPAAYGGLAGQSAAVMVWADRGVQIDWPSIQFDTATLIQSALQKSGADEVKGTSWPYPPASVARYQKDHPGIEAMSITDVAPRLGVSRLIYVEIQAFATRSEESLQMYRGVVMANLKVVEVSGGEAKIGYEESGIQVVFPPKSRPEGLLNASDGVIYRGTLPALAEEIVHRLTTYYEENK